MYLVALVPGSDLPFFLFFAQYKKLLPLAVLTSKARVEAGSEADYIFGSS